MTTVRDLLNSTLRLLGVLASGETASSSELTDGLSVLNSMLDSWSTENLLILSNSIEEFDLVSGQQSYTIGASGNFNTSRPVRINNATLKYTNTTDQQEIPLEIINLDQWSQIDIKSLQSGEPRKLFYNPTFPLATIYIWPKPTTNHKIVLYTEKLLTSYTNLSNSLSLSPGYLKAVRYNLAVDLAPEYGKSVPPEILKGAEESKSHIMRLNTKPELMQMDDAVMFGRRSFDYRTGH